MSRSSVFRKIESKFKNATYQEITTLTLKARDELFEALENEKVNRKKALDITLFAAIVGMLADGKICAKEKLLFKRVFQEYWGGDIKELIAFVEDMGFDEDYDATRGIARLGEKIAYPYLDIILGFAYIDGVIEEEVATQLDEIFGFYLLTDLYEETSEYFLVNGHFMTKLSQKILKWYEENKNWYTLDEVCEYFSEYPRKEVKKALTELVKDALLRYGPTFSGNLYGPY